MKNHPSAPTRNSRKAFTLIELLVVIAVIGVLAAILIPSIQGVRERAVQTKCVQKLRTWAVAIQLYAQDNNGNIYYNGWNNLSTSARYYNGYFGVETVPVEGHGPRIPMDYYRWCPGTEWNGNGNSPTGYAFCRPSDQSKGFYWPIYDPINLRRAANPAKLLLMIDAATSNGRIQGAGDLEYAIKPICQGDQSNEVRHKGSVNALFADGHVSTYRWEDIDQDTPEEQQMVEAWFHLD